ncbi:MAG: B12-binding domain-containing radical SAM protein [Candidatus Hydrogenedentes bacterium]|nr:B12-binding domain-containing radical SAM protein [Candidatus Hydrogenedentota bacterium]
MKVLLISVQKNLNILNLKLLHTLLITKGIDSHLLYLTRFSPENRQMLQSLEGFIKELQPNWVGISLTASEFSSARDVTLFIKNKFGNFPVIWGGIYPTSAPKKCAKYADYLCIGEGEKTVIDICEAIKNGKSLKNVKNIAWLEGENLHINPLNPLIEDLNSLPFVPRLAPNAYILFKDKVLPLNRKLYMKHSAFKGAIYRIVSSRGCPYKCTYCVNSIFPKLYSCWRVRWPTPQRIVEEIKAGVSEDLPLNFVSILDDNFFAQKIEFLESFFSLYKQKVNKPLIAVSSPDFITEEKIKMAVDGGLSSLHVGLQTGSEFVCKDIYNRPSSPKNYVKIAQILHKYPIIPYYDIICDNPFETEKDEIETIKMLADLPKPYFFLIFSLTFYEGTPLRERVEKEYPHLLHDDTKKDFLIINQTPLNLLKHLATIVPKSLVLRLLSLHQKKPNSLLTKFILRIAKFTGIFFFQPLIYLWILLKFNKYSISKTIINLPKFLDIRIFHIFGHFYRQQE